MRVIRSGLLRSCCIAAVIALSGSAALGAPPRLERHDAVRIANARARRVLHDDYVRDYRIYFVRYFPQEGTWAINYRHVKKASHVFFVEVSDTTRKATVLMP